MGSTSRLQHVSARELNEAFFSAAKNGWRRIAELTGLNLIKNSRAPIPGRAYSTYSLTSYGLDRLLREFPDEPVMDGFFDRIRNQALVFTEHRESMSALYLSLIRGEGDAEADCNREAIRLWMAEVRQRASQIRWFADGTFVFNFDALGVAQRLVPDATIECPGQGLRLFVELDNSHKTLARMRDSLNRYATFCRTTYGATFADNLAPVVVFLVASEARRNNVAAAAQDILGTICRWAVLVRHGDAVPWLAATLWDEERLIPGTRETIASPLRADARAFLSALGGVLTSCRDDFEAMKAAQPEVMARFTAQLASFNRAVKGSAHG
jgi:hypothetical protein